MNSAINQTRTPAWISSRFARSSDPSNHFSFQRIGILILVLLSFAMGGITARFKLPPEGLHSRDSSLLLAMGKELHRTQDSLRLGNLSGPYFQSYLLWDMDQYHIQASLGSIEKKGSDRQFLLDVDLRVGDTTLDNTLYQGGFVFGPTLRAPLPQTGDTLLLRQSIWALTDARYKVALEMLAQKKAFLSQNQVTKRLPDFSRQQITQFVDKENRIDPDTSVLVGLCQRLSQRLAKHDHLLESRVAFQYYHTTFYYIDAWGTVYVTSLQEQTLLASVLTQAEDGTPLWDYFRMARRDSLPVNQMQAFEKAVGDSLDDLAMRLKVLMRSPTFDNYRGPVLFTGLAAGDLIHRAVLMPQTRLRESVGSSSEPNFLISMQGHRYFPPGIDIVDEPSQKTWKGRKLFGAYQFDHQGQPAQPLKLVVNGKWNDFYMGKVPVFSPSDLSNGHWRYGGGFPGVLKVTSKNAVPDSVLVKSLQQLTLDEGLREGLVVLRTVDEDAFKLLSHPLMMHLPLSDGADGLGSFSIPAPCAMDRIDAVTGKRQPIRGLVFPPIDTKSLRDIVGVGENPHLLEPQASFSLLSPALLFSLLDLKHPRNNFPSLPYLPPTAGFQRAIRGP
jgi:TldD protein